MSTIILAANNANSTLAGSINNTAVSITLAAGGGALFPSPAANQYFLLTLNDAATGLVYEIVRVTARSGDTLTVVRGQEGTTAVAWLAGDLAVNMFTAGTLQNLVQISPLQTGQYNYAVDTGSANNYIVSLTPNPGAPGDGFPLTFRALNSNSGPATVTLNGNTYSIVTPGLVPLVGGEIQASGTLELVFNTIVGGGSFVLVSTSNMARLTALTGLLGSSRNLICNVTAASATATWTAGQIIVGTSLTSGAQVSLPQFNNTLNLAATGANGMDTGTAPASGFVSVYAIAGSAGNALLACNVTTSSGTIYTGANMPSGYTSSSLISIWATNASRQLVVGSQIDRKIFISPTSVLNTSTQSGTPVLLSVAGAVPPVARTMWGDFNIGSSVATNFTAAVQASAGGAIAQTGINGNSASTSQSLAGCFSEMPLITSQSMYWLAQVGSGTMSFQLNITGYTF